MNYNELGYELVIRLIKININVHINLFFKVLILNVCSVKSGEAGGAASPLQRGVRGLHGLNGSAQELRTAGAEGAMLRPAQVQLSDEIQTRIGLKVTYKVT